MNTPEQRRSGPRISRKEAREIALAAMTKTDKLMQEERNKDSLPSDNINQNGLDLDLLQMERDDLIKEIQKLRNGIRFAHHAEGDERCWLDYIRLAELLPEFQGYSFKTMPAEEMRKNCDTFIECMQEVEFRSVDQYFEEWDGRCPYKRNCSPKI